MIHAINADHDKHKINSSNEVFSTKGILQTTSNQNFQTSFDISNSEQARRSFVATPKMETKLINNIQMTSQGVGTSAKFTNSVEGSANAQPIDKSGHPANEMAIRQGKDQVRHMHGIHSHGRREHPSHSHERNDQAAQDLVKHLPDKKDQRKKGRSRNERKTVGGQNFAGSSDGFMESAKNTLRMQSEFVSVEESF